MCLQRSGASPETLQTDGQTGWRAGLGRANKVFLPGPGMLSPAQAPPSHHSWYYSPGCTSVSSSCSPYFHLPTHPLESKFFFVSTPSTLAYPRNASPKKDPDCEGGHPLAMPEWTCVILHPRRGSFLFFSQRGLPGPFFADLAP